MEIILFLGVLFIMFIKFVTPCLILSTLIICLIRTKSINKTFKILILIIILLCIFIILINIVHEKPNDLYIKMNGINNSKILIGLSKEQVVELLGEPTEIYKDRDIDKEVYMYHAGYRFREITWGKHTLWAKTYWYVFSINFDETDKVESTLMKQSSELAT